MDESAGQSGRDTGVAILFADVVGSTRLYEVLGDGAARELVARCLREFSEATELSGGSVIKTMGDEILAIFPEADAAVDAACQMQRRISGATDLTADGAAIAIRVGCHLGSVVREKGDVFGGAVHIAKRVVGRAKARQILASAKLVDGLAKPSRVKLRPIDLAPVKGHSDKVVMFEVLWHPREVTAMRPSLDWLEQRARAPRSLELRCGDRVIILDDAKGGVALGRDGENDLVVQHDLVSRIHARIEASRGRFVLVDESTNGTLVVPDGGEPWLVRRDATELRGEGLIWLGGEAQHDTRHAIRYALERSPLPSAKR